MDGNREEGERCIHLAERFLELGEVEQALKYLNKAERLWPSKRAKDLLDAIENQESAFSCFENYDPNDRLSSNISAEDNNYDTSRVNREPLYTDDQLAAVRKIRNCKDYYETLGVDKDCIDEDLKKSYKKLALKFHPDKNRAPGTTEAFKAISNAFAVLSNPIKRREYDQRGCFNEVKPLYRRQPYHASDNNIYEFTNGFEGDVSADELFRMFFGAAFQPGDTLNNSIGRYEALESVYNSIGRSARPSQLPRTSRTTLRPTSTPRPPPVYRPPPSTSRTSSGFLLQISPILFLVVLSLFSTLLVGDSAYSLQQDLKFSDERSTRRYGINYFVRSDFDVKYPPEGAEFRQVELQVEEEHVSNLQYHCYRERSHRENMIWRARVYHNDALLKQAKELGSPSCDAIQALRVSINGGEMVNV